MARRSLLLFAVLSIALLLGRPARAQETLPLLEPIFSPPESIPPPSPCFEFGCFDGSDFDRDTFAVRGASYDAIYLFQRDSAGTFVYQTYVVNPDLPEPAPGEPDPHEYDQAFGRPFLLRGNDLLVASGARVLVFRRWGSAWFRVQTLPFPEAQVMALAWDRGTLLVGSSASGTVRVFRQGPWGYYHSEATLPAPGTLDPSFGTALAIDGDTALVGAPAENAREGAVYVYQRYRRSWRLAQKLTPHPDLATNAQFGTAIAIEGLQLAIGAPTAPGALPERSGFVQIYARRGRHWYPGQRIPNLVSTSYSGSITFGNALALERGRLLAGGSAFTRFGGGGPTTFLFDRSFRGFVPTAELDVAIPRRLRLSGGYALADDELVRFGSRPELYELPPPPRP